MVSILEISAVMFLSFVGMMRLADLLTDLTGVNL